MTKKIKRFAAGAAAVIIGMTSAAVRSGNLTVSAKYGTGNNIVEGLDRGITAVNTGSGMLVSWRFLANDDDNAVFNLYRDNTLVYTSNAGEATCYLDGAGTPSSVYKVETVSGGKTVSTDTCTKTSSGSYFDIPLDKPAAQTSGVSYSPNDCSVGDVDGDGEYELFVKWDPSNSKDNSQKGVTDKVFIDCYRLDGTKLWRIDLGVNIRAGAHYTQFLVADFDCDGKAEMTCKTADGTVDGTGIVIGDAAADYRNSSGYILSGNEYYTLFDGLTGAALDTVTYEYGRGTVSAWGDSYGNRVDRFLGAVCYLDGVKPSAVSVRGYYTRMTAVAYDVVDKKLVKRWGFDTGNSSSAVGYGDGNHNCMPADVDNDGKQELVLGGTCLDDDGTVLWNINRGHGDALHVGDLLPERSGIEVWICHEDSPYGVTLLDGSSGEEIFHYDGSADTGRCCADNVWTGNDGAEFWGLGNDVYDGSGTLLSCRRPAINFLIHWDGDLEREILDGYTDSPATITDMGTDGKLTTLLTTDGYYTCNTTKGTPCLSADILGDWREELVVRAADGNSVRIYATTYDTDYRITTLMHDVQYRTQVAGQNTAYNQPPHTSFYLGSEEPLPERPAVAVGETITVIRPAVFSEGSAYRIKNVNSGLYLDVTSGKAANAVNIQQAALTEDTNQNTFRFYSAGSGYYCIVSSLGDGSTFVLDITGKKTDNGTNIELYSYKSGDNQKFKFLPNEDGSYKITAKLADDASCIEVANAEKESGANVQLWEINGVNCQDWILEPVSDPGCVMDESKIYMIRNVNSNLPMDVAGGVKADGTNIQQWGATASAASYNSWRFVNAGSGYYKIASEMDNGNKWFMTVSDSNNIEIKSDDGSSAQLFKFVKDLNGNYAILTKASEDACSVEIGESSTSNGGNVQQGTSSSASSQKWILEEVGTIEPTFTAGDVNLDSMTDSADAVLLRKYLVRKESLTDQQSTNADMNSDGKLNVFDLIIIKRSI
ncbi:MAG: RICIN domain-containing protein [Porcipelethomonas sp.]